MCTDVYISESIYGATQWMNPSLVHNQNQADSLKLFSISCNKYESDQIYLYISLFSWLMLVLSIGSDVPGTSKRLDSAKLGAGSHLKT